jgi:hypothetical protein
MISNGNDCESNVKLWWKQLVHFHVLGNHFSLAKTFPILAPLSIPIWTWIWQIVRSAHGLKILLYLRLVLLSTTNHKIAKRIECTTSALEQRQKSHPSSKIIFTYSFPKPWSYWTRTCADQNHLNLWCPKKR